MTADYGDVILTQQGRRLVVEQADLMALIDDDLLRQIQAGRWRGGAKYRRGVLSFGTRGRGVGRVWYRLDGRHDAHSWVMLRFIPRTRRVVDSLTGLAIFALLMLVGALVFIACTGGAGLVSPDAPHSW